MTSVAARRATSRKLERLRGHKLTYVDGTSLVLLEHHRIGEVWGTARDLARAVAMDILLSTRSAAKLRSCAGLAVPFATRRTRAQTAARLLPVP
jgi:hypothetical protein